ncbi:MarR family winged helix-turn-helix transcriptional regulator [Chitinimonas sp. BJB300]|uniref:MarR family winged helix-turn-helix transcriptional regulator n=1 Tax=Chitinimonas sp. BJB300 TaxID=1559339 RepID=UPI000C0F0CEB|nr:MarR family transcriptional regulator [Chitinimonas sp. BJB300]PHV10132.1 MarR family transcriptional regulator [Chitinimonas sp. BJB300]TSJ90961.1 MarR family transcriptional regulator [Chitinimonas sp. BJB300]
MSSANVSATSDWMRLDAQLCFRLYAASRTVTRCYQPLLADLGLTYPQYLVMLVLWEEDDLTVKGLGARLMLDSGTLTPLLKRLEVNGLIGRERRPANEREVRLRLTEAGQAMRSKAEGIPPALMTALGLSFEELHQMRTMLDKLLGKAEAESAVIN